MSSSVRMKIVMPTAGQGCNGTVKRDVLRCQHGDRPVEVINLHPDCAFCSTLLGCGLLACSVMKGQLQEGRSWPTVLGERLVKAVGGIPVHGHALLGTFCPVELNCWALVISHDLPHLYV